MPGKTQPHTPQYAAAPLTTADRTLVPSHFYRRSSLLTLAKVDYADLAVIDLSKGATPEGRAALAVEARRAVRDVGFFYVIGHGYTQDQVRSGVSYLRCHVPEYFKSADGPHIRYRGRPVRPYD